jgi:hypothetical protein
MYSSAYSWHRHHLEVSGQLHFSVALLPGESASVTLWIGGWVGTETCLEAVERRRIVPLPGFKLRLLGRPTGNQLLYRLQRDMKTSCKPQAWMQNFLLQWQKIFVYSKFESSNRYMEFAELPHTSIAKYNLRTFETKILVWSCSVQPSTSSIQSFNDEFHREARNRPKETNGVSSSSRPKYYV